jgi:hypothetical protein
VDFCHQKQTKKKTEQAMNQLGIENENENENREQREQEQRTVRKSKSNLWIAAEVHFCALVTQKKRLAVRLGNG